jgi:hypothetical protein
MNGVYNEAIKRWGERAQTIKLVEECGELIQAASKWLNARNDLNRQAMAVNCIEEIADVEIMIRQFKKILQPNFTTKVDDLVFDREQEKLLKLRERLDQEG